MSFEIEHAPGTSMEDIKKAEKEFKKDCLAKAQGLTREEFNAKIDSIKGFFEERKEYMHKNKRTSGNTTIYPTSKECLRGCTHIHKDAPEGSTCQDCAS